MEGLHSTAAHVQEMGLTPGRGLSHPLLLRHGEEVTKPLLNKLVLSKRWIWHFQHKTLAEVAKPESSKTNKIYHNDNHLSRTRVDFLIAVVVARKIV